MSFLPLIKTQVQSAFTILDDIVKSITWTARVNGVFSDGAYTYTKTDLSPPRIHFIDFIKAFKHISKRRYAGRRKCLRYSF